MNSSRRRLLWGLAMGVLLTAPLNAFAGVIVPSGSRLSDLLAPNTYLEIDGFRFKNFRVNPDPPTTYQPDPDDIIVSAVHNQVDDKIDLYFNIQGPNATLRAGEAYDMVLEFDAHAPEGREFTQQRLSSTGGVIGTGEVTILEVVETVGPPPESLVNLINVYFEDAFQSVDVKDFPQPEAWIHVQKDINVFGGFPNDNNPNDLQIASLTDFQQTFMYAEVIPEPASLLLAMLGIASMSITRRRES